MTHIAHRSVHQRNHDEHRDGLQGNNRHECELFAGMPVEEEKGFGREVSVRLTQAAQRSRTWFLVLYVLQKAANPPSSRLSRPRGPCTASPNLEGYSSSAPR